MKLANKVYRQILDMAQPVKLEGAWAGIKVPSSIRSQTMDAAELVPLLQAKFSAEELLASGVCLSSPNGADDCLILHPGLAGQDKPFLALCMDGLGAPFDLLTDCGCVSGALPSTTMLSDATCGGKDDAKPLLFVTFSIGDLIPLVSLGLSATTAAGMSELSGRSLEQFCTVFNFDRQLMPEAERNERSAAFYARAAPPDLVLVGWQPGTWTLAPPAGMAAMLVHFTKLASYQGVELHDVGQWQPTADDFDRLMFVKDHGSKAELRHVFLELAESAPPILARAPPVLPAANLADVRARLARLSSTENNRRDYQEIVKLLEGAVEQEIVAPLEEQLAATIDAPERLRLHSLISTSRIVFKEMLLIEATLARKSKSQDPLQPLEKKLAALKDIVSLFDRLRLGCREAR